jgi:hypothetical protein
VALLECVGGALHGLNYSLQTFLRLRTIAIVKRLSKIG